MTTDPDLRAIRRRRRQEGRCVTCGLRTPRAALCASCRTTRRWCPRCEVVWDYAGPCGRDGESAVYCPPCKRAEDVRRRPRQTRAEYLASHEHPQLRAIIRLYRRGLTLDTIAAELGMGASALRAAIHHARATGRWPKGLKRGRSWRPARATGGGACDSL